MKATQWHQFGDHPAVFCTQKSPDKPLFKTPNGVVVEVFPSDWIVEEDGILTIWSDRDFRNRFPYPVSKVRMTPCPKCRATARGGDDCKDKHNCYWNVHGMTHGHPRNAVLLDERRSHDTNAR